MTRYSNVLFLIFASCIAAGWSTSASAQSHGISQNRLLSSEKSTKSMNLQVFGLAGDSTQLDSKAAVTGWANQGEGKSLAFRDGFGSKNSQTGIGQLQRLQDKGTGHRHVGEEVWGTAFEGMKVKSGPSKGKLPDGASLLQSRSSAKGLLTDGATHAVTGDGWSHQRKDIERLK